MFNSFENAMLQPVLVTGGSGFIGSNFIHQWIQQESAPIINLDCLTYAANPANLASIEDDRRYTFVQGNICDRELLDRVLDQYQPRAIIHFAAESHVDRSIVGPGAFVQTNVNGTFTLLEAARRYWGRMDALHAASFRFLHVSTDEVFGSLSPTDPAFTEETAYAPNSPYSASKAASDHLVRAYFHTYGMPTLITNCSNNYGPFQFPEKLIPLMIRNATKGMPLPIYGDGMNVRDWLFVEDHCEALRRVLADGRLGDTYNIGGSAERTNLDVVTTIVDMLDELQPLADGSSRRSLLQFVKDRPGHDRRYAVNTTKIRRELGWQPREQFETGIRRTVEWYLREAAWVEAVCSGEYRKWISRQYSVTA